MTEQLDKSVDIKNTIKEHSGIVRQFVDVGYSEQEADFMFDMYYSKLEKFMTPEQLSVYSDVVSSEVYRKFVETNTHFSASSAYDEFLHEALLMETQQQEMKFDA